MEKLEASMLKNIKVDNIPMPSYNLKKSKMQLDQSNRWIKNLFEKGQ